MDGYLPTVITRHFVCIVIIEMTVEGERARVEDGRLSGARLVGVNDPRRTRCHTQHRSECETTHAARSAALFVVRVTRRKRIMQAGDEPVWVLGYLSADVISVPLFSVS